MMVRGKLKILLPVLAVVFGAVISSVDAYAQAHNYINNRRSSTVSHFFVTQSVDGEFGRFNTTGKESTPEGMIDTSSSPYWQGFGIGSAVGLEVLKFIQFNAGHTFVNMRNRNDGLEKIDGSRLNGGVRLVFTAPVANLEAGGGVLASRMDYTKRLDSATFYGSGYYYTLGLNYFISSQVSFFGNIKMNHENLVRNGGSTVTSSMVTDTTLVGFGFTLWL